MEPESTYFAWLDCTNLGITSEELVLYSAILWLDSGSLFGEYANQFQRIVLVCPRVMLTRTLDRLKHTVFSLK